MCVEMKAKDQLMSRHIKSRCAHPGQFILQLDLIVATRPPETVSSEICASGISCSLTSTEQHHL